MNDGGSGYNVRSAAIGTDAGDKNGGDLTISGLKHLNAFSEDGAGVGAGAGGAMGNIQIQNVKEMLFHTSDGAGLGAANGGTVGNINISGENVYGWVSTSYDSQGTVIGHSNSGTSGNVTINAEYVLLSGRGAVESAKDSGIKFGMYICTVKPCAFSSETIK